ncbi:unnamed protein product [Colias eurytheme]|nr:unnamed protein product [Colias eurytheme]
MVIPNKENSLSPEPSTSGLSKLPMTSNFSNSHDKENYFNDDVIDDGDFSPASDDDRTYTPAKLICRISS